MAVMSSGTDNSSVEPASSLSLAMASLSLASPPPQRLSSRRGSASACDPFNVHAVLNHHPDRGSSSTLTIVRLPSTQAPLTPPHEPPASPVLSQRRHRRSVPGSPGSPQTSQPLAEPSPQSQPSRLSFAFSSFSASSPTTSARDNRDRAPSPSSSPRLAPLSPRQSTSGLFLSKPRLGPEQIVDLARLSISPRAVATTPPPAPASSVPLSSVPLSYSPPHSPIRNHAQPSSTTFTPLPDDVYLPFIDRPSEVASLISIPPGVKLFALLAQTIGSKQDSDVDVPLKQPSDLPNDPAEWTYRHLAFHLTKLDRDAAPDTIWAYAIRRCVISRSELIWERVKGALGIPPELDIDWNFSHRSDGHSDSDSVRTEDISDDEGRAACGHWSDWDAIMDSPVFDKRMNRSSADFPFSPGSHGYREVEPENQVVIEQITVPPPSFSAAPPPLSLPLSLSANAPADALGDIAEGPEEEEEEGGAQSANKASTGSHVEPTATSQILGLRISTAPIPVTPHDTPPVMSSVSPSTTFAKAVAIPGANKGSSYMGSLPHSRSSSVSSIGPFKRTESSVNTTSLLYNPRAGHPSGASDAGDTSSILSDLHMGDWVSESRAAGLPLFPSNFARLSNSPTLNRSNSRTSSRSRALSHGASSLSGSSLKRQSWGRAASPVPAGSGSGSE